MSIAKKILSTVVALPAILFVVMGLRWLVNPAGIAVVQFSTTSSPSGGDLDTGNALYGMADAINEYLS